MENVAASSEQKPIVKVEPTPVKLERYDEIERKVREALDRNDIDTVLLLNELTFSRNLEEVLSKKEVSQFGVVYIALRTERGIIKRAGIYNTIEIPDPEDAENVLLDEDFNNRSVLAIPRNSIYIARVSK